MVWIPLRTVSETNAHEHWRIRQRRAKLQRQTTWQVLRSLGRPPPLPCCLHVTRIAPRALDSDNLQSACKHIRDGIADWFGLADRDPRLSWVYEQRRGAVRHYAIEITWQAG